MRQWVFHVAKIKELSLGQESEVPIITLIQKLLSSVSPFFVALSVEVCLFKTD